MIEDLLWNAAIAVSGAIFGYHLREWKDMDRLHRIINNHHITMEHYHAAREVILKHDLEQEYQDVLEDLRERD